MATPSILQVVQNEETLMKREEVKKEMEQYDALFTNPDDHEKRKKNYTTMVNNFYDLVTDFYEYGWGESFHFANRFKGESFRESILRTEHYLALKLQLKPGMKVLDIGCGVGGPLRNIARFSGASITGLNNNDYQIKRGTKQTNSAGLASICDFMKADFMKIPVADNTYDAAYAIESTCHSPDKTKTFAEVLRILKPGGLFTGYEWCMTPRYKPNNAEHKQIKFGIEVGNGLPDIAMEEDVVNALKAAGFEVIEAFNTHSELHSPEQIPWYNSLSGDYTSPSNFRHTPLGMMATHSMVTVLERIGLAPQGTTRVHDMLHSTAKDLVRGGQLDIFTPDYFFLARKPE
jgi:sterol 24-C-methyltransferase